MGETLSLRELITYIYISTHIYDRTSMPVLLHMQKRIEEFRKIDKTVE